MDSKTIPAASGKTTDEAAHGQAVDLEYLLSDSFIRRHTAFSDTDAFLYALPDHGEILHLEELDTPAVSAFIAANSDFHDFAEMLRHAGRERTVQSDLTDLSLRDKN